MTLPPVAEPGIFFIGPGSTDEDLAAQVTRLLALPPPYRGDDLLSLHLVMTSLDDAQYLGSRKHTNNTTGEEFRCLSYYTEDQIDPAVSSHEDIAYVSTMSMPFVRRLIKIVDRLGPAIDARPRAGMPARADSSTRPSLNRDPHLDSLLEGDTQVTHDEALGIVSQWPILGSADGQLGAFTVFYDMIRLIWVHEWSHSLTGHVAFSTNRLGLERLHEFSVDRTGEGRVSGSTAPRNEILQQLELHADEFAVRHCIGNILWGHDPMADVAGSTIELHDRLLLFNVACCVFTVLWALAEARYAPEDTFYPPPVQPGSSEDEPIFQTTRSTHPPAVLRYDRFRGFQRDLTAQYGQETRQTSLSPMVDAYSYGFLEDLGALSPHFRRLDVITPMVARTPTTKRLIAYEEHLLERSDWLASQVAELSYLPTL